MPKDVQKLPSAISTNPLIAGVGWGDMFHFVVIFDAFDSHHRFLKGILVF